MLLLSNNHPQSPAGLLTTSESPNNLRSTCHQLSIRLLSLLETSTSQLYPKHLKSEAPLLTHLELQNIVLAAIATMCYIWAIHLLMKHHDGISTKWRTRFLMGAWSSLNCALLAKMLWNSTDASLTWGLPVNFLLQSFHWDVGIGEGVRLRHQAIRHFVRWGASFRRGPTGNVVEGLPIGTEVAL